MAKWDIFFNPNATQFKFLLSYFFGKNWNSFCRLNGIPLFCARFHIQISNSWVSDTLHLFHSWKEAPDISGTDSALSCRIWFDFSAMTLSRISSLSQQISNQRRQNKIKRTYKMTSEQAEQNLHNWLQWKINLQGSDFSPEWKSQLPFEWNHAELKPDNTNKWVREQITTRLPQRAFPRGEGWPGPEAMARRTYNKRDLYATR